VNGKNDCVKVSVKSDLHVLVSKCVSFLEHVDSCVHFFEKGIWNHNVRYNIEANKQFVCSFKSYFYIIQHSRWPGGEGGGQNRAEKSLMFVFRNTCKSQG